MSAITRPTAAQPRPLEEQSNEVGQAWKSGNVLMLDVLRAFPYGNNRQVKSKRSERGEQSEPPNS